MARKRVEEFWFEDYRFQCSVTKGLLIVELLDEGCAVVASAAAGCTTRSPLRRADIAYSLAYGLLQEHFGRQPMPLVSGFLPR